MKLLEEMFWRFPHIGDQILEELNNESFLRFRELTRWWRNFIDGQKMVYIRKLLKEIGFSTALMQKTLLKETLEKLKEFSEIADRQTDLVYRGLLYTLIPMDESDCYQSLSFNLCKLIIYNSEDKNPIDEATDFSVLEIAAFFNKVVVYQLIMDRNNNKNPSRGFMKKTPLHLAASTGNFEVCQLILQNIQDVNPKAYFGETPLEMARQQGHDNICRLIESALQNQKENQTRRLQ